jgi:hypothetical protein
MSLNFESLAPTCLGVTGCWTVNISITFRWQLFVLLFRLKTHTKFCDSYAKMVQGRWILMFYTIVLIANDCGYKYQTLVPAKNSHLKVYLRISMLYPPTLVLTTYLRGPFHPGLHICDWIWENPPYGIRVRFVQSVFLVAQVEICQSPDFVIHVKQPF